jgi:Raf kinase inhibitor-like YbhB/YbcL family protein
VWTDSPAGTQSLVLIVDDPDAPAGTWVHWVLYDLPPNAHRLDEALPPAGDVEGGGRQGTNDFGKSGYGGPCPPPGKPHRYFFKLYALDSRLNLKAGATKLDVEQAMKGHVLAKAEVMGRYRR